MLRSKTRTKGRKYPRRTKWIPQRDEAFARADRTCEISGEPLGRWVEEQLYPPREAYVCGFELRTRSDTDDSFRASSGGMCGVLRARVL